MSRVTMTITDDPDGLVNFQAEYVGGYDPVSHAHKISNQVIKFLEDQAVSKLTLVPEPLILPDTTDRRIIHG